MVALNGISPRKPSKRADGGFFEDAKEKAAAARVAVPKGGIIADKKVHRFKCDPKDTKKSCAYIAHPDGVPNIAFYDHRKDTRNPVFTVKGEIPNGMDAARIAEEAKENQAKHEAEDAARHAGAEKTAQSMWDTAVPASPDHPYLKAKGTQPHGSRQIGSLLLVPVMQGALGSGKIAGMQTITPAGEKRFLEGTPKTGGYLQSTNAPKTTNRMINS